MAEKCQICVPFCSGIQNLLQDFVAINVIYLPMTLIVQPYSTEVCMSNNISCDCLARNHLMELNVKKWKNKDFQCN